MHGFVSPALARSTTVRASLSSAAVNPPIVWRAAKNRAVVWRLIVEVFHCSRDGASCSSGCSNFPVLGAIAEKKTDQLKARGGHCRFLSGVASSAKDSGKDPSYENPCGCPHDFALFRGCGSAVFLRPWPREIDGCDEAGDCGGASISGLPGRC